MSGNEYILPGRPPNRAKVAGFLRRGLVRLFVGAALLWSCAFAWMRRPGASPCLEVPDRWAQSSHFFDGSSRTDLQPGAPGDASRVAELVGAESASDDTPTLDGAQRLPNALSFVLLWSTNASTFDLRARRCIESIFYHHPKAHVRVFSNELPDSFFGEFRERGYNVNVRRYNLEELLGDTPAAPWLLRLAEWQRGSYFYSHVTDAVRIALLFKEGGVYLDTDVILAKPLTLLGSNRAHSATGTSATRRTGSDPRTEHVRELPALREAQAARRVRGESQVERALALQPLRNALGIESYDTSYTPPRPILNGAVLAFKKGSRFLWNCLHEFAADYKPDRWGWNGPELLTRVQERCKEVPGGAVQVEPPETFYPLHWSSVSTHSDGLHGDEDTRLWGVIEARSYAVHIWNRKTAELEFTPPSLLYRVMNEWTVLPTTSNVTPDPS